MENKYGKGMGVETEDQSEIPYGSGIPDFQAKKGKYRVFVTHCDGIHILTRNHDGHFDKSDGKDHDLDQAIELAEDYIEQPHASLSVAFIFNDVGNMVHHMFNQNKKEIVKKLDSLDYLITKVDRLKTIIDALQSVSETIKRIGRK